MVGRAESTRHRPPTRPSGQLFLPLCVCVCVCARACARARTSKCTYESWLPHPPLPHSALFLPGLPSWHSQPECPLLGVLGLAHLVWSSPACSPLATLQLDPLSHLKNEGPKPGCLTHACGASASRQDSVKSPCTPQSGCSYPTFTDGETEARSL